MSPSPEWPTVAVYMDTPVDLRRENRTRILLETSVPSQTVPAVMQAVRMGMEAQLQAVITVLAQLNPDVHLDDDWHLRDPETTFVPFVVDRTAVTPEQVAEFMGKINDQRARRAEQIREWFPDVAAIAASADAKTQAWGTWLADMTDEECRRPLYGDPVTEPTPERITRPDQNTEHARRWADRHGHARIVEPTATPKETSMDIDKIRRVENLAPGDKVKTWGDDLEVVSADPTLSAPMVLVKYQQLDGTDLVIPYGPGTLVEIA